MEFHFDCLETLPQVLGNKEELIKAVRHLLSNALQFTTKGKISLRSFSDGNKLTIEVEDTGIGIHEEDFPRLFTLFTQIHSSNLRFGSGLGLAFVKKIIEKHNGTVSFESTFEKGSTFRIELPTKK